MMGALYLGALLAAEEMADGHGRPESPPSTARSSRRAAKIDELLWNGEYYVQKYDQVMDAEVPVRRGCLSDQLLGQWFSHVAGLGHVLPRTT